MSAAETNNGYPRMDFVEYDHPDGLYTVEAHVVTKATEGEYPEVGGGAGTAREGDVLVKRGNAYERHSAKAWAEMNLEGQREQRDLPQFEEVEVEEEKWDPSEHTAQQVRLYLRKLAAEDTDESNEEYNRVVAAEQEGKNRPSAFPKEG